MYRKKKLLPTHKAQCKYTCTNYLSQVVVLFNVGHRPTHYGHDILQVGRKDTNSVQYESCLLGYCASCEVAALMAPESKEIQQVKGIIANSKNEYPISNYLCLTVNGDNTNKELYIYSVY